MAIYVFPGLISVNGKFITKFMNGARGSSRIFSLFVQDVVISDGSLLILNGLTVLKCLL